MTDLDEAIGAFMRDNPSVTNPALILHGILEAHPDLREGNEIDLDIIGLFVQCCEPEPPR
ncbi:hypothetical protein W02_05080 [Nitrospira sp. KM1]|uniref:hypothetical protein n=1 Tax=Nitrospira sp. KM1 TaxID=1936990 RepID=UPI0013A73A51|nr:hypothetical protein [Nitrospira sp. KM1]BCA53368.1 hypothetical protein W02_05080 [Nitrospira sp. KM1]